MEIKAYIEGIVRGWWLICLCLALSFFIANNIGENLPTEYTAFNLIQLNSSLLVKYADPTQVVQLGLSQSYIAQVAPPVQIDIIQKHYPRLSRATLTKNIVVTENADKQSLVIQVTDISPQSATDIANYLAQHFVQSQTAELQRQLSYYDHWLPQRISSLQSEIGKLSLQIQQLTPVQQPHTVTPPLSPANQRTLATDQSQLDADQRDLYSSQQAYTDLQNAQPLFAKAYIIVQQASTQNVTAVPPTLSPTLIRLIGLASGFLIALILLVVAEYCIPLVRHEGEIQRIAELPVAAKFPDLNRFEQKRLLHRRSPLFHWRTNKVLLACALLGTRVIKAPENIMLLTSPRKKRSFAPVLASQIAASGQSTLLIDLDFDQPTLQNRLQLMGQCDLLTERGASLPFISKTTTPGLYALPATARLAQNRTLTSQDLIELLPELRKLFNVIIIDAPPLNRADTHRFAKLAGHVFLLIKKRRDQLVFLKMAQALDQELKLHMQSVFLG